MKTLKICFYQVDEFSIYTNANGTNFVSCLIILSWKKLIQCAFRRSQSMENFPCYFIEEVHKRLQKIRKFRISMMCWKTRWINKTSMKLYQNVKNLRSIIENHFKNAKFVKADLCKNETFRNRPSWSIFHKN